MMIIFKPILFCFLFNFLSWFSAEQAQPTDECPHQFGYYRLGDSKNCGQFMNCANGRGYVFDCPEGLAFNQATYQCDWPDLVAECDAEGKIIF